MAELLEGSKVLAVPLFQRRYSWGRPQWRALWANVREQYEYQAVERDTGQLPVNHFIGSFVLSPVVGSGPPQRILVVDGQQRLITVSVLLAAIRDLRWEHASMTTVRNWLENDFTKAYLTNSVLDPTPDTEFRVLPTQEDRGDFASTIGETPGSPRGSIGEAYRYFRKEVRARDYNGESYALDRLTDVILTRLSLVDIRTEPGDNVHRVFQTLNSSGVMLKQVDLLRNHFFMLLPTRGDELYRSVWRDMELRLGETAMDKFFWASLVQYDTRVSRKTVFSTMQSRLSRDNIESSEEKVEATLDALNEDSKQYLKLIEPSEEPREEIRSRLDALDRWGTDTYYPLGLRLLKANRNGDLSDDDLDRALLAIESFLVRRMLAGLPTNNLNRIFASMTGAVPEDSILAWLQAALVSLGRIWPNDETVRDSARARPYFFSGQPGQRVFVLQRVNQWLANGAGWRREDIAFELVHVMPSAESEAWPSAGTEAERETRERLVNTIGNMALVVKGTSLTGTAPLSEKRDCLTEQNLAVNGDVLHAARWTSEQIGARSERLADAIIDIWPGPTSKASTDEETVDAVSEDIALSMPVGTFTTVEDLAEYWSVPETAIRAALSDWSLESLSRVRSEPADDSLASPRGGPTGLSVEDPSRRLRAADLARLAQEEDAQNLEQTEE